MEINNVNNILAQYYNALLAQNNQSGGTGVVNMPIPNEASVSLPENIANYLQGANANGTQQPASCVNNDAMSAYLASKQADLGAIIPSFQGYPYSSNPAAPLIDGANLINPKDYVVGAIIIDPQVNEIAGELFKANAANFSMNEWRAVVEQAILANGGLGNSEDGFLAWSKDGHFVRLRNTNLTPEQNQKLASMSLEFGWPVEDLPSSKDENIIGNETKIQELDTKIAQYQEKIEAFRQDPNQDFTLKYGKQRFHVAYDAQTGVFASRSYKLRSGIKGWFDKCAKKISTGLGIAKSIFKYIPGWGTIVSACCGITQKLTDFYRARNVGYAK